MAELTAELGDADLLAWLYTPMALPLARALDPDAAVYDCMDELSLFLGAPPELLTYEARAAGVRRCDVHRRAQPVSGQAVAPPQCALFSQQRRCRRTSG